MKYKFGRKARAYNPRIFHLSALMAGKVLPAPPASVDYTRALTQGSLGMFLNDRLGDCTAAAWYHAIQVWTANSQPPMLTYPDADVEKLYEETGGYVPGDPSTDQGAVEQDVLTYLTRTGSPDSANGAARNILTAFIEVDPRNTDDVKRTIDWCGVAYIGMNVPAFVEDLEDAGSTWDVDPSADNDIVGGHAVVLAGYRVANGKLLFKFISWGAVYEMTEAFFAAFVDEVYALADWRWLNATNKTIAGWPMEKLEALMAAV